MPTICIDCRYINGRPSGIGEVTAQLVARVPGLAPDLSFLLLRHPAADGPLGAAPNVREVVVPASANGPATMWWLPRLVDLTGVDLFHAPFNIMPAGLGMPTVVTMHDTMWLDRPDLCETGWRGWARAAFFSHGMRRALRRASAIAVPSEATRMDIAALSTAAAGRTTVVPSGVSGMFRPARPDPAALDRLGLDRSRRFVLTVGQWAPYKNHQGAVHAFARAAATREDVDLVLVQRQGRRTDALLRLAAGSGLHGRIRVLRSVEPGDLVQLYSSAAALLHPSLREGFGNPLVEAMACGCPVITSNLSAMPEVTGGAALLGDPADPAAMARLLGRVLDEPDLAGQLRQRGLARSSQLSWDRFAEAMVALYRGRLAGQP